MSSVNFQAKDAASAVSLSVSESQPRPTVELFGRTGQIEEGNQLRLHSAGQEEEAANNNNTRRQQEQEGDEQEENFYKESRARRRRRVRRYCQEEEVEDVKEEEKTEAEEEILLGGVAVTKEVDCCQDCGASLPSEWHRPPNRHDCQAMSETVCQVAASLLSPLI